VEGLRPAGHRRLDRARRSGAAEHIRELEEIGVKPPKTTPIFYRVSADFDACI